MDKAKTNVDELEVPTPAAPEVPVSSPDLAPKVTDTVIEKASAEAVVDVKAPWEVPAPFPVADLQVPEHIDGALPTPAAPEAPVVEKVKTDKVTVTVPNGFELTIDHNTTITIRPGIQEMEKSYADHWYSIANGVVIYEPKASE